MGNFTARNFLGKKLGVEEIDQFFASLFFQRIRKVSFIGIFLAGNEIDLNSVAARTHQIQR